MRKRLIIIAAVGAAAEAGYKAAVRPRVRKDLGMLPVKFLTFLPRTV